MVDFILTKKLSSKFFNLNLKTNNSDIIKWCRNNLNTYVHKSISFKHNFQITHNSIYNVIEERIF